jgi:hypothetical protein
VVYSRDTVESLAHRAVGLSCICGLACVAKRDRTRERGRICPRVELSGRREWEFIKKNHGKIKGIVKASGPPSTISCVSLCDLLFKNEESVLCILQEYKA